MADAVETIECGKAEEFLTSISPRGEYFGTRTKASATGIERWLFRGQARVDWPLLPSALRTGEHLPLLLHAAGQGWRKHLTASSMEQGKAETRTLHRFFWMADSQALALPNDSQQLRRQLARFDMIIDQGAFDEGAPGEPKLWPPEILLPTLALAQHHGIATRLLDWTRRSFIAAYFAAHDAAARHSDSVVRDDDGRLAVYAFKAGVLEIDFDRGTEPFIELVAAPRHGNPNLHAQSGVFTVQRLPGMSIGEPVDRRTFDELLKNAAENYARSEWPLLRVFTLPRTLATELLWLLNLEGITAAAVFPGFKGVALALMDEELFDAEG